MSKKEYKTHPSYGTVQFSRVTCGGNTKMHLFGSPITNHFNVIDLIINRAEIKHDLHQDTIFGHDELIRVRLSAAQFAELLTTMNVGSGVPCTILRIKGQERIPDPPGDEIELDRVKQNFEDDLKELLEDVTKQATELHTLLEKKSLTKEDKRNIQWIVEHVKQAVGSNFKFAVDQFGEATDKVVSHAKAEIDHFVTAMVQKTGLEQLQVMSKQKLLKSGKEEPEVFDEQPPIDSDDEE